MSHALHDVANGTLFGVALNYRGLLQQHQAAFVEAPYKQLPVKPVLFVKTPNTRNQHEGQVLFPANVQRLQPGPALGVVIGKDASRVSVEDALEHVAGYTIVNETSLPEDSYYRPAVKAKCRDGFCPIGPALVPASQVANPDALGLRLYVNGELRQHNNTANCVRTVAQLIAEISEFMTLHAGDILITGTPEGRVDVQPGDRVDIEIDGLGKLTNHIVAE
ncbi:TPA: fumarylacetoacetate hydrolase family protein [Pseudomonas putida]|jgi:5-oxopent-3-ene-1,2,5-tricarboxylate decarboxylase/2-hydroxyhepta-2,4-diene-1,7-dioate isomerase|uniref:4-hydroxyphenylacetate degradation bifunctional isomerase/decarboxylase, HpaG1 subunit n=1 Tax=Pseudomonas putida (strain GB-1) TaxID=76869 RepID=B0KKT3_PSEPG|nr:MULTISPECIES: fumarylacetoacetate hydrolase family protein [Pseudomonas]ABY99387.1 4-hydroxyphenylacetate degradation bifunctional isomerase/decarboxylase, HpaG1 subunit [Pseudomonas putida GB-1]APE99536.1 4-hydroxyphenylacetate isomerase [Pseudomonas putida]MBP0707002.1 fumarylacetoacetate hydrolase family protein [Pseudomonas sp. T34]MCE1000092.1 fumarylacetoacetate hydrolase family protein [Pseudomonas sp. NMI1173_11]MCK2186441.1 fumarylacetoacetate hydrolase family protein [Pseudomonas 